MAKRITTFASSEAKKHAEAENERERVPRCVGRPALGGEGDLTLVSRAEEPLFGVPFGSSTALPWFKRIWEELPSDGDIAPVGVAVSECAR